MKFVSRYLYTTSHWQRLTTRLPKHNEFFRAEKAGAAHGRGPWMGGVEVRAGRAVEPNKKPHWKCWLLLRGWCFVYFCWCFFLSEILSTTYCNNHPCFIIPITSTVHHDVLEGVASKRGSSREEAGQGTVRIADGIGPSDFAGLRLNHNQLGLSMANIKLTAKNAEMPKWSFWPVWKK